MKNIIKKAVAPLINYYYRERDKKIIPPYSEKREIILSYKSKYSLKKFIETGTFLGDTINEFKNDFDSLTSFELSIDLAQKAKKRFESYKHIEIVCGDSADLLGKYLSAINEPCLFWLDGHYSSEFFIGDEYIKTAKGKKETPILEELKAIFTHTVKNHVILIDDARCFNGKNDYPTMSELKSYILSLNPKVKIEKQRDIIRITPAS